MCAWHERYSVCLCTWVFVVCMYVNFLLALASKPRDSLSRMATRSDAANRQQGRLVYETITPPLAPHDSVCIYLIKYNINSWRNTHIHTALSNLTHASIWCGCSWPTLTCIGDGNSSSFPRSQCISRCRDMIIIHTYTLANMPHQNAYMSAIACTGRNACTLTPC